MDLAAFQPFPDYSATSLPAEDQSALKWLSSSEVPLWTSTRLKEYRRRINELEAYGAALSSIRNSAEAPVFRLPNDVLMEIFSSFSPEDCSIRIQNVCRRWRFVLLATPRFWAKCISSRRFDASDSRDQAFLRVALQHAGALSLSIRIRNPTHEILETLADWRPKISQFVVENCDNSIMLAIAEFFRSDRMGRLRTLRIESSRLNPRVLIEILEHCPLLHYLQVGTRRLTGDEGHNFDLDIGKRTISLPHLRELAITATPSNAISLLRVFQPIPSHTLVELTLEDEGRTALTNPPFDFHEVLAAPSIDRVCMESSELTDIRVKGYAGSSERLRITNKGRRNNFLKPLLRPISVLVVNSFSRSCHNLCMEVIGRWDLPHLRRLEVLSEMPDVEHKLAASFLSRRERSRSELTLAYVLRMTPDQDVQDSYATGGLFILLQALLKYIPTGTPRLGRLELYVIRKEHLWEDFNGSVKAGSDARLCSQVVAPFLGQLRKLVDDVQIG